jgi:hypothetical protein
MAETWKELCSGGFSHGNSTGTGSSQTIAHSLGAAPNFVSIVPTESGIDEVSGLYVDATNIYVTVTSGIDYNWSAGIIV